MPTRIAPLVAARSATLLAILLLPLGASGQFPQGGPGQPAPQAEVSAQFDRDGNGLLDASERPAALEFVRSRPQQGRGGGGGGRGGGFAPASPGPALSPAEVVPQPGAALYDPSIVRTLFLEFENDQWEEEMAAFFGTDVQLPARLTVDGTTFEDIGVRFRGNSSFRNVSAGSKRPLRLKLDAAVSDQAFAGARTLTLLNAMSDPTFLRAVLYSEIAGALLPVPRVGFVRLVVNGESWGLYPLQQAFNRDFVVDHFGAAGGARWEVPGSPNGRGGMVYLGPDIDLYRSTYEIDSDDDEEDWTALIEMFRVLNETPIEGLEAALEPILNVDGVLRFLAVEAALVNTDGYWARASDYYIYRDPEGRFHVLPHDMNEALGTAGGPGGGGGRGGGGRGAGGAGGGAQGGGVTLDPLTGLTDASKPLRSRLLQVPALREAYLGYVREIAEVHLDWETLGARVAELRAVIDPLVRADTRKLYSNEAFDAGFEQGANSLRSFADQRRAFLLSVIPTP